MRSAPLVTDGVFQWWSLSLVVVVDDGNGFKFRLMIIELGTSHHQSNQHTGAYVGENMGDHFTAPLQYIIQCSAETGEFSKYQSEFR